MTYKGVGTYNGKHLGNTGTIGTLTVTADSTGTFWGNVDRLFVENGGRVENQNGGRITTAYVEDGRMYNQGGTITTANVSGGEAFHGYAGTLVSNGNGGTIVTANIRGGSVVNQNGSTINMVKISGGEYGGTVDNDGHIGVTEIVGGTVNNKEFGTINEARLWTKVLDIDSGQINNEGGVISTMDVYGGLVTGPVRLVSNIARGDGMTIPDIPGTIGITSDKHVNNDCGTISRLNVYDGAQVNNSERGIIDTLSMYGGIVVPIPLGGIPIAPGVTLPINPGGIAAKAILALGEVNNEGIIHQAIIHSGDLNNRGGYIGLVRVLGGDHEMIVREIDYSELLDGRDSLPESQISIDPKIGKGSGLVNNDQYGEITTAYVEQGGILHNKNGLITTAYVGKDGIVSNERGGGNIDTAFVIDGGWIYNNGVIGNVNLDSDGWVSNMGGIQTANVNERGYVLNLGKIDNVTLKGGEVANLGQIKEMTYSSGTYEKGGTIGTLNVVGDSRGIDWGSLETANVRNGGVMDNYGTITTANIGNGGRVNNNGTLTYSPDGYIASANLGSGGALYNYAGIIDNVEMTGGYLGNYGRIGQLVYYDGVPEELIIRPVRAFMPMAATAYNDQAAGFIETLVIAGNLNYSDSWGSIGNIAFDSNGGGILTISAFVSDESAIAVNWVSAVSIDLTWGNIVFDLTGLTGLGIPEEDLFASLFTEFSLASFFGTTEVMGGEEISSFQIARGEEWFFIFDEGNLVEGWNLDFNTGSLSWDGNTPIVWSCGDSPSPSPTTPEPATLAILGLGLAGLGLAARRRRK